MKNLIALLFFVERRHSFLSRILSVIVASRSLTFLFPLQKSLRHFSPFFFPFQDEEDSFSWQNMISVGLKLFLTLLSSTDGIDKSDSFPTQVSITYYTKDGSNVTASITRSV